jgi:hypothetical protein
VTTVTNTGSLNILTQPVDRNPTETSNLGTKLILPLLEFEGVRSSVSFGLDYKSYRAVTIQSNLTTTLLYSTNPPPPTLFFSTNFLSGQATANSLYYLPLSLGWSGSRPDKFGSTSFNCNQYLFLPFLQSSRTGFQQVAGSQSAGGLYTSVTAGLTRQENLPGDWSVVLNANGQWASAPLISNEQFGLGGVTGVRGYQEGEVYGDAGWRVLFDLRAPPVNVGYFPTANDAIPALLRCSTFMDYGQALFIDRPGQPAVSEWGTGFGFFLTVGEHVEARLTVGWALIGSPSGSGGASSLITVKSPQDSCRAYFSLRYQF